MASVAAVLNAVTPQTIPNSMYLTSAPAFFGSNTWPWVDPTTGTTYTLPAKARFDAGTPNQIANQNNSFTIAVSASPSAGGTVAGGGTFASGSSDTVTATPNSGYMFANWTENGTVVSTAASYTFTLTANRNLVANFTVNPVNYTIALSASPSAGGTVSGGGTFTAGTPRTVTATANSGYTFANWTENGTVVSTAASYTFTLNGNRNLVANFTVNPVNYTIAVSASPSAGGTVSGSGTFTSGSFTHRDGDSQQRLHVHQLDRKRHGGQHCGELHLHAQRQPQPGRQFHRQSRELHDCGQCLAQCRRYSARRRNICVGHFATP